MHAYMFIRLKSSVAIVLISGLPFVFINLHTNNVCTVCIYIVFLFFCLVVFLREPQGNELSVTMNQLWDYETYSALITSVAKPIPYNTNRKFSVMTLNLKFQRQSLG